MTLQPKPVAVPFGDVARYDVCCEPCNAHLLALDSPCLMRVFGNISQYDNMPSDFSSRIASLTCFAKVVDSVSLYEPVITLSKGFSPKSHSTKSVAVLDLPCLGGKLITRTFSVLS